MPKGYVAPGWVLPTCGLGHHQVSARPCGAGRSVTALPMNGSTCSSKGCLLVVPGGDLPTVGGLRFKQVSLASQSHGSRARRCNLRPLAVHTVETGCNQCRP